MLKLFPIQANFIGVKELTIKSNVSPDPNIEMEGKNFTFKSGHGSYDPEQHIIDVGAMIEAGFEETANPEEKLPFQIRVHLVGRFQVDEGSFPKDKVELWAKVNAPFILFPYLREHVFALTARCGFEPVLLPLVELPTFKIEASLSKSSPALAPKKLVRGR